jgi:Protein of unknown function (DUF1553)
MERRYMLNEQRNMERLAGLNSDGQELNAAYETYWREQPGRKEREKQAKSALALLERGDDDALKELAAKHADAVAAGVTDPDQSKEQRVALQKELLAKLQAEIAATPKIPPRAMIPCDVDKPADESVRPSGQFDRLGEQVPRGFLRVIGDQPAAIPEGQSGRLELARWLTDTDHGAGQLAARVLANRVWHHLLGCGLVRTVDNFGRTGEVASHPELLDNLARELIDSGWSLKHLIRKIVSSRTFALSSHSNAGDAVDPDNRLLWRASRRRLEPEALRDAMLTAADQLDLAPRESTVSYLGDQATAVGDNKVRRRTDFPCRSVYLPVIRNDLPELFDVFDFANPHASTGMRPKTMVATQGLFMLNDGSVMRAAEATARRLLAGQSEAGEDGLVDTLFEWMFHSAPTVDERAEILTFVRQIKNRVTTEGGTDAQLQAWSQACHALFAASRFQILD